MRSRFNLEKAPVNSVLEERKAHLEQAFYLTDAAFIDHKQNHVVAALHHHVTMGNDDLFTAHNGADGGAFGEIDLSDGAANHFRGLLVAVSDRLDRFRGAPAQRVDVDDVAPAHVGQQAANGRLLG